MTNKRIEQAWAGAKGWITEFTGAPNAALLVNAPAERVAPGLEQIAAQVHNARFTIIPADKPSQAQFITVETIPAQVERLLAGELAELSANWAVQQDAFDLDLHLVVYPLTAQSTAKPSENPDAHSPLVSLELDWWSDQVFSEDTDNPAQFAVLAGYFLELQTLFGAANLFLSAESGLDPSAENDDWVEI